MAIIINTAEVDLSSLSPNHTYWLYNGFDGCITREVHDTISLNHTPESEIIYRFERAMQAPALDMMLRGVLVDQKWRAETRAAYEEKAARLTHIINRYADAIWGKGLNPGSPAQKVALLYDFMRLPPQTKKDPKTGRIAPTTNREALEKLSLHFHAKPLIKALLAYADVTKKLGVLKYPIDADGRFRSAYAVAGTETGRWSSSANAFGTGANWQNITEELRRMFIADPGHKVAYIDLEQAESRVVGLIAWLLFGDSSYLDACLSGDLHSLVCQMCWSHLPWPEEFNLDAVRKYGTLPKDLVRAAKKVAGMEWYRGYSYRDGAKKLGHGSNYYGKPFTMARHARVETKVVEDFQWAYFAAFPGIPRWHQHVAAQLQLTGAITTALGRRRVFFGRASDDATLREAIAYEPQSFATGDYLNLGLLRTWEENKTKIIGQIHDAIAILYPERDEAEVIPSVESSLLVEIPFTRPVDGKPDEGQTRMFSIPSECKVGWNFSYYNKESNPDGLKDWAGYDDRTRTNKANSSLLDFRF